MMRGEEFLTKPKQYALVYRDGNSRVNSLVVMKARPSGLGLSRYGISVSRRLGKAVVRNRVKRRFREILRRTQFKPGWDIIFIARPAAADVDYTRLKKSVDSLLARAELLTGEKGHEGAGIRAN